MRPSLCLPPAGGLLGQAEVELHQVVGGRLRGHLARAVERFAPRLSERALSG
ncbi:TPA: hypothetical protein QDZ34_000881 [Stenotrophomonas maltophilia]|nr:hypothetical protein [Stenotrophomonas maltophilia]HDS1024613.1 hypothetical protein [Stenotrophomonas maltophilia]HDS1028997.1 hypothetical protein [Stenotrophomonas maltophilia]HDS1033565.1 hypothetical protein [Stenotrophomonas maltophilia]